jgi:hypothetical protein
MIICYARAYDETAEASSAELVRSSGAAQRLAASFPQEPHIGPFPALGSLRWLCGIGSVQRALAPIADCACSLHAAPLPCGHDHLALLHVALKMAKKSAGGGRHWKPPENPEVSCKEVVALWLWPMFAHRARAWPPRHRTARSLPQNRHVCIAHTCA